MAHCSALDSNRVCRNHPLHFRGLTKLSQQSLHLLSARKCRSSQRSAATVATAAMLDRAQPLDITGFVAANAPNGTPTPDVAPVHPAEMPHLSDAALELLYHYKLLSSSASNFARSDEKPLSTSQCNSLLSVWARLLLSRLLLPACSSYQLIQNTWCVKWVCKLDMADATCLQSQAWPCCSSPSPWQ